MTVSIPFQPSDNNYRLVVPLHDVPFIFDVRWNTRERAWYFDLREEDETLILANNKVVIDARPGHTSTHSFFATRLMQVVDTSNRGIDPAFDDLGARVILLLYDVHESPL